MKGKILIAVTIVLSSLIGSASYYITQQSKQQSIEKQQQLKIEQEQLRLKEDLRDRRKKECYTIYDKERATYSNTDSMYYYPLNNECVITYKQDNNKKAWCYTDNEVNTKEKIRQRVLEKKGHTEIDDLDEKEKEYLDMRIKAFNLCKGGNSIHRF